MTEEQYNTIVSKLDWIISQLHGRPADAQKPASRAPDPNAEDKVARMLCPKCEGPMRLKVSRNGNQFASCQDYPSCDGLRWMSGDAPAPKVQSHPDKGGHPKPAATAPSESSDDVPF